VKRNCIARLHEFVGTKAGAKMGYRGPWLLWIGGKHFHMAVRSHPGVQTLSAGCNHIRADPVQIIGGRAGGDTLGIAHVGIAFPCDMVFEKGHIGVVKPQELLTRGEIHQGKKAQPMPQFMQHDRDKVDLGTWGIAIQTIVSHVGK
jgi:hypothetical protein